MHDYLKPVCFAGCHATTAGHQPASTSSPPPPTDHVCTACRTAGCHGHHGQLPAGEYLVTTSAHAVDAATGAPQFLPWREFLAFSLDQGLPLNDTWLVAGSRWAQAARDALDALALTGGPTGKSLHVLEQLVKVRARRGLVLTLRLLNQRWGRPQGTRWTRVR